MAASVAAAALLAFEAAVATPATEQDVDSDPVLREAVAELKAGRPKVAEPLLLKSAAAGNVTARLLLGEIYSGIRGFPANNKAACDQFEIVGDRHPEAPHNLATCFYRGEGRPQDFTRARALYQTAVGLGFLQSKCALGNMLIAGQGGEPMPEQGVALCMEASEAGDKNAQADLGNIYLFGKGAQKDFLKARQWYLAAAEQGQANAAFLLGQMHINGDSGPVDRAEAKRWLRVAFEGGRKDAARLLADQTLTQVAKIGAKPSASDMPLIEEAIDWHRIALEQGDDKALRERLELLQILQKRWLETLPSSQ